MNSKSASKGFTLIEVLVSLALISIVVFGFSQVLDIYLKSQRSLDYSERKQEIIISVINLINNDIAWQKTIDHAANTNLDCLKEPGKFPAVPNAGNCLMTDGGKFSLLDEAGTTFIDYVNPAAGLNLNSFCNTFALTGNDACPLRVELSWRPLCITCANNQVEITIDLRESPLNRKSIQARLISRKVVRYAEPYDRDVVLFMKMDGSIGATLPIGTTVTDKSGLKNHGVATGTAGAPFLSYIAGRIGQGLRFENGKSVTVLDSPSLRPGGPITVAAWVNAYGALTAFNGIISKRNSGTNSSYNLRADGSGFSFCVAENAGSRCVSSATVINPGTWYYVVGTWDLSNINLYINGVLSAGPLAYTGPNYWSNEPVLIGAENQGGTLSFFPGIIDQIKIWKRSLKPNEVLSQYNNL